MEREVTEPRPVFNICFSPSFIPLHPGECARLLGEKVDCQRSQECLVNTGWTSGPYGNGHRIMLAHMHRIVSAILNEEMDSTEAFTELFCGLTVSAHVTGMPDEVLDLRNTWNDPAR